MHNEIDGKLLCTNTAKQKQRRNFVQNRKDKFIHSINMT